MRRTTLDFGCAPAAAGCLDPAPSGQVSPDRGCAVRPPGGKSVQACGVVSGKAPVRPIVWQSDPVTQNLLPPPSSHRTGADPRCGTLPACAAQPLGQHGNASRKRDAKNNLRKTQRPFDRCIRQFVQWRVGLVARLSILGVAARKRVEQEPPGKKNEIMPLDSVNARILLDSHCL